MSLMFVISKFKNKSKNLLEKNRVNIRLLTLSGFFFVLSLACTTKNFFSVKSEPVKADVYVLNDKSEKKALGQTPLEVSKEDLKNNLGANVQAGEFFTVIVEKPGFVPQSFNIPATQFGTSLLSLTVKLKEGTQEKEMTLAKEALDRMFLAQKLALANQFERAQIEVDKVISQFPTFARALSMRASIYYAQKNYQESMKWYEETLKQAPDMEEAVRMLAKVRVQLGLPPAAISGQSPKPEEKKP